MKRPGYRLVVAYAFVTVLTGCTASQGPSSLLMPAEARPLETPSPSNNREDVRPKYRGLSGLYVSDTGGYGIRPRIDILKNGSYADAGMLKQRIVMPAGNFIDELGNFYVADLGAGNIKEYAPHAEFPGFTYNTGMKAPVDVTVDRNGNVYEADSPLGESGAGSVREYAQRSNVPIHTCATGGDATSGADGVAVDREGDVFVVTGPKILEYKHGLSGCVATPLDVTLYSGDGIALDRNENLIVTDAAGSLDIIAPPYTHITRQLDFSPGLPIEVRINKNNTLLFLVAQNPPGLFGGNILVLDYPSGAVLESLTLPDDGYPSSAVDGPNAVY